MMPFSRVKVAGGVVSVLVDEIMSHRVPGEGGGEHGEVG